MRAKYVKKIFNIKRESNTGPQYKGSIIIRQTTTKYDCNF